MSELHKNRQKCQHCIWQTCSGREINISVSDYISEIVVKYPYDCYYERNKNRIQITQLDIDVAELFAYNYNDLNY